MLHPMVGTPTATLRFDHAAAMIWEAAMTEQTITRAHLSEASSRVQKAQHYLVTLCTIIFPIQLWFFWMITIVVAPKFKEIFKDMLGEQARPELFTFFDWATTVFPALVLCLGVPVLCGVILYILGPRPVDWLEWLTPNYLRWIARPFHALARFADRGVLLVPGRELVVARLGGTIVGSAQLVRPPANNEAQAFAAAVTTFFMAPSARGHGLARGMLSAIDKRAAEQGVGDGDAHRAVSLRKRRRHATPSESSARRRLASPPPNAGGMEPLPATVFFSACM